MAGLLWQLHHLSMALVANVADEGDALLQVHLQGQQASVPLMSPHHRSMHPLHLPAHVHTFLSHSNYGTYTTSDVRKHLSTAPYYTRHGSSDSLRFSGLKQGYAFATGIARL